MGRRPIVRAVLVAGMAVVLLPACDPPPPRPTFTVTTTADGLDAVPGDGVCEVTAGGGFCSVRAALTEADAVAAATVVVPDGEYDLTVSDPEDGDADLDVTGDVRLNPGAPGDVRIEAAASLVLDVHAGGRLAANGLFLGFDGPHGVVRVDGDLVLGDSIVQQVAFPAPATPALEVLSSGTVALSNTDVFGTSTAAAVVNRGTLLAQFSGIGGLFVPALHTDDDATSVIAATRVAQWWAFRASIMESRDGVACTGTMPDSRGYNRVPNDSCDLGPTDTQTPLAPWVDRIPVGVLGCGDTFTVDRNGATRPEDGDFDGTPACDVGATEQGVPLLIISTVPLPPASVGQCYDLRLTAQRGTVPYTWTVSGLPAGLELVGDRIVGIPEVAGSFAPVTITVRTVDGGGSSTTSIDVLPSSEPPDVSCPG